MNFTDEEKTRYVIQRLTSPDGAVLYRYRREDDGRLYWVPVGDYPSRCDVCNGRYGIKMISQGGDVRCEEHLPPGAEVGSKTND